MAGVLRLLIVGVGYCWISDGGWFGKTPETRALELGCSTGKIKAPQKVNLGEPKNMKQLAPAAAL